MKMPAALRIARRELRGGIAGFRIFLACIALGVASITIVGSVRSAIQAGLAREATTILGGDAEAAFTYRRASADELAWMNSNATKVSETIQFRSMLVRGEDRALVQVKAVDSAYPIYGAVELVPQIPLAQALAGNGIVAEKSLVQRLDLAVGDEISLGASRFTLRAVLLKEPDNADAGFSFGPKIILRSQALEGSGLLEPGSLFNSAYRLALPDAAKLPRLKTDAEKRFSATGLRWTDRRNAAPGIARFVDRMGSFLVLVGLAGLAVGGIGVSAAVRSYLERKTDTIATLKTLGASGSTIFSIYLTLVCLLGLLGIALGLIVGAAIPAFLGPLLADRLPVPALFAIYPRPLAEAALYGILAMLAFSIWPLARTRTISAGGLFRDQIEERIRMPEWSYVLAVALIAVALIACAAWFSDLTELTLWFTFAIAVALGILWLAALLTRRIAGRLAKSRLGRRTPALHFALGAVGGPGGETTSVILSLGLGLAVLATIGQIDANLQNSFAQELPEIAPAFFVLDIQSDQIKEFKAITTADTGVEKTETTPMLRGVITRINDSPTADLGGHGHWALHGDRGVTYSAAAPQGTILTEGQWWPPDYDGPPLVSFAAAEAAELGLKLGDSITVNVLGRDITARITSLRVVEFRDMGINFLMVMNPGALQGAPHSHIATIYSAPESEGRLLRAVADRFPNITMISVRDGIETAAQNLASLASATRWGAATTLLTGLVVLIGAAAAGELISEFVNHGVSHFDSLANGPRPAPNAVAFFRRAMIESCV